MIMLCTSVNYIDKCTFSEADLPPTLPSSTPIVPENNDRPVEQNQALELADFKAEIWAALKHLENKMENLSVPDEGVTLEQFQDLKSEISASDKVF